MNKIAKAKGLRQITDDEIQEYISDHEIYEDDGMICPYCGYKETDPASIYEEGTDEYECSNCGKTFMKEAYFTWSFITQPTEEEAKKALLEQATAKN